MTLTEIDEESQYAQSQYDTKHKAYTIATHHTGSNSSRAHVGGTPPMRMGTPPVDCGTPKVTAQHNEPNRLSQFNFNPVRAFHNARQSFLPSYHSTSPTKPSIFGRRPTSSLYSRTTSGAEPLRKKFWQRPKDEEIPRVPEISYPLNVNPQFAHLVKPDLAHHPSQRRPEADLDRI